jgi:hypothetical protein
MFLRIFDRGSASEIDHPSLRCVAGAEHVIRGQSGDRRSVDDDPACAAIRGRAKRVPPESGSLSPHSRVVARASPHIGDHAKARARNVFIVAWEFAAQEFLLKHRPDSYQYRRYDRDDGAGKRAEP